MQAHLCRLVDSLPVPKVEADPAIPSANLQPVAGLGIYRFVQLR